jgi:hypothetical protein
VRATEYLVGRVVASARIVSGKQRRDIQRELRSHIDDFVEAAINAGHAPDEIEKLVLANFGDPRQIAEGFAWVYRHERRRLQVFAYMLSTVLLAACLSVAVLAIQAGLAFSLGSSVTKVIASRHTVIEALDILVTVAAFLGLTSVETLFARHSFGKAASLLGAIFIVPILSCAAAGWPVRFLFFGLVNAVFLRAVQRFIPSRIVRAALVLICFSLAGLVLASLLPPMLHVAIGTICASWFAMGAGYLLMSDLAARVDSTLLDGLQRLSD